MNAQRHLAEFIASTSPADVPASVHSASKRALLDTLAAAIAGASSGEVQPAIAHAQRTAPDGPTPVIGTSMRTAGDQAALLNGTLCHALDFDDTVSSMPGHPGAVVLPALLSSLAMSAAPVAGQQFLTSLAVGYEAATKMGRAIGMGHYRRGWHATGSMGVFGATAAVASLEGATEDQVMNALGIASSHVGGLRVNFGTMTKSLHSGMAARAGLLSAQLAVHGFTGNTAAFEGTHGLFATYEGEDTDPSVLGRLGQPYTLVEPGIAFKKYACCFAMHRVIDVLETWGAEAEFDRDDIVRIAARVPPGSLGPLPYSDPQTGLEGKFSLEYALAIAQVDGDYSPSAFTDEAVLRPEITAAKRSVQASEDETCWPDDPADRASSAGTRGYVEVAVTWRDGRTDVRTNRHAPGSPARPLTDDDLRTKFRVCAATAGIDDNAATALIEMVDTFDTAPDATVLIAWLAGAGAGQ